MRVLLFLVRAKLSVPSTGKDTPDPPPPPAPGPASDAPPPPPATPPVMEEEETCSASLLFVFEAGGQKIRWAKGSPGTICDALFVFVRAL